MLSKLKDPIWGKYWRAVLYQSSFIFVGIILGPFNDVQLAFALTGIVITFVWSIYQRSIIQKEVGY